MIPAGRYSLDGKIKKAVFYDSLPLLQTGTFTFS